MNSISRNHTNDQRPENHRSHQNHHTADYKPYHLLDQHQPHTMIRKSHTAHHRRIPTQYFLSLDQPIGNIEEFVNQM